MAVATVMHPPNGSPYSQSATAAFPLHQQDLLGLTDSMDAVERKTLNAPTAYAATVVGKFQPKALHSWQIYPAMQGQYVTVEIAE